MDIDDSSEIPENHESETRPSLDVVELAPEDESELAIIATDDESESGSADAQAAQLRVPIRDDSSSTFRSHSAPVFSVRVCNWQPNGKQLCLTGGQDDRTRLWELNSAQQLFECSG